MVRFDKVRFQNGTLKCKDLIREVLQAEPTQKVYGYVMGKGPHYSLLVTSDRILPHLYFLRTVISNYQGAMADAMEIFHSNRVDVRANYDVSIGNVAMWNVCLAFPKGKNFFKVRDKITRELQQKCGIVPPIDFFFVEFFRHHGNVEERVREMTVSHDCDLHLSEDIVKEMGIQWNTEKPSAVVATPFELMPGILFSFVPPEQDLVECELLIADKVGSMSKLSKAVSVDIDLVASGGMAVVFGKKAVWRFCGISTGSFEDLKSKLRRKRLLTVKKLEKIDPSKL